MVCPGGVEPPISGFGGQYLLSLSGQMVGEVGIEPTRYLASDASDLPLVHSPEMEPAEGCYPILGISLAADCGVNTPLQVARPLHGTPHTGLTTIIDTA